MVLYSQHYSCAQRQSLVLGTAKFVIEAKRVHGDTYDYDDVVYTTNQNKVKIVCPPHGPFMIRPSLHTNRRIGCTHCSKVTTTEDFIAKANLIHGDKYEYTNVEYINSTSKVDISCITHGAFQQTPNNHISGHGCVCCARDANKGGYCTSIFSKDRLLASTPGMIYFIKIGHCYKIGITKNALRVRFRSLQFRIITTAPMRLEDVFCMEQLLLQKYNQQRYTPSNRDNLVGGHTECLILSDDDVKSIVCTITG